MNTPTQYTPIPSDKAIEGATLANLCICNNCYSILIDSNPQINAPLFQLQGSELEMKYYGGSIEDKKEDLKGAWVCPVCNTDEHLMDLQDTL